MSNYRRLDWTDRARLMKQLRLGRTVRVTDSVATYELTPVTHDTDAMTAYDAGGGLVSFPYAQIRTIANLRGSVTYRRP